MKGSQHIRITSCSKTSKIWISPTKSRFQVSKNVQLDNEALILLKYVLATRWHDLKAKRATYRDGVVIWATRLHAFINEKVKKCKNFLTTLLVACPSNTQHDRYSPSLDTMTDNISLNASDRSFQAFDTTRLKGVHRTQASSELLSIMAQ